MHANYQVTSRAGTSAPFGPGKAFIQSAAVFRCQCGRPIFFGNTECLGCGEQLGYECHLFSVAPLTPAADPGSWTIPGSSSIYRRCANLLLPAGCNWLVATDAGDLCLCCRLNRTIPNLTIPENGDRWRRIEAAKRRMVASLLKLRLPVRSWRDGAGGLAFDLLSSEDGATPVSTGHLDGVITINADEADDVRRESIRAAMREPYRTILGHIRHETGHYYWQRLVADSPWTDAFRELFGDERQNYASALEKYYREGPPIDWSNRFVSAYASAHPWEDWAETWAHYFHMVDGLAASRGMGLCWDFQSIDFELFTLEVLDPSQPPSARFLSMCNDWLVLSSAMNEISRSMGLADFYPFVLTRLAVRKLHFVDKMVELQSVPA